MELLSILVHSLGISRMKGGRLSTSVRLLITGTLLLRCSETYAQPALQTLRHHAPQEVGSGHAKLIAPMASSDSLNTPWCFPYEIKLN